MQPSVRRRTFVSIAAALGLTGGASHPTEAVETEQTAIQERWNQEFSEDPSSFRGVTRGTDGYVAAGRLETEGWLVQFDDEGSVQWDTATGVDGANAGFEAVVETPGGFVAAGLAEGDGRNAWLVAVDGSGQQRWEKLVDDRPGAFRSVTYVDGMILAAGQTLDGNDGWIVAFDTDGQRQWAEEYGPSGTNRFNAALVDGGDVVVGGSVQESSGASSSPWLLWIDPQDGSILDVPQIQGDGATDIQGIERTASGGLLAVGSANGGSEGFLARLSDRSTTSERVDSAVSTLHTAFDDGEDTFVGGRSSDDRGIVAPLGEDDTVESGFVDEQSSVVASIAAVGGLTAVGQRSPDDGGGIGTESAWTTTSGSPAAWGIGLDRVEEPVIASYQVTTESPTPGDPVSFDASGSSPPDDIDQFEWSFTADDDFEALGAQPEHVYDEPDEYEVSLRVSDADGTTDTTSQTVTVAADGELTASFSIENEVIIVDEEIQFDGTASQPASLIETYEWDFTGDSDYEALGPQPTHVYEETAELNTVRLRVTTDEGETATTEEQIEVVEDGELDAAFFVSPNPQEADKWVQFDAGPSTPERIIESYEWTFPDGSTENGSFTFDVFDEPGEYQMSLTVSDQDGNTDEAVREFEIIENLNLIPSFSVDPEEPAVGETVTFDASDTEAELGVDTYRWDFDFDGESSIDAEGETVTHTYDTDGEYSVVLEVTDNGDNTTTDAQTVAIGDPELEASFDVDPAEPVAGESIQFDASDSVPESSIDTYEWQFKSNSVDGETGRTVTHDYDEDGEYEVTLTVTDDEGETDQVTQTVSVDPLELDPQFSIDPSFPQVGDTIEFDATDSEPADEIESYEWEFDSGNFDSESGDGDIITHEYDQGGEYEVVLTISNGDDLEAQTTQILTVEDGSATARFDVDPENPAVGETVTVDASRSEADDEIESYEWEHSQGFGAAGQGIEETFTFDSASDVTITLTIETVSEVEDETSQTITVEQDSENDGEDDDDDGLGSPGDDDDNDGGGSDDDEDLFPDDEDEDDDFFDDDGDDESSDDDPEEEESPDRDPGEPPEDARMPDRLPLGAAATLLGGGLATRVYRRISEDDDEER